MAGVIYYFAYGSNLDTDQMRCRCRGSAVLGPARLDGYRLAFTASSRNWGGGVADVIPDPDAAVWGLLYTLTEADLRCLDRHEGCPHKYTRSLLSIEDLAGKEQSAWTYTVVRKREFVPPTSQYLSIILTAAEHWDFPEPYRDLLRTIPTSDSPDRAKGA